MLKVSNVYKSFQNNKVLSGVDFSVDSGEIVTILGKNGAGKTTILNSILKLIQPDEGEILFLNKNIRHLKDREYFSQIGVVLESSNNVYDYLTGYQNIEYFLGLMNEDIKDNMAMLKEYLVLFDLKDDINKKVGDYSRGMVQKLAILIALLGKPKLLLLDEPTLGLDIQSKYLMLDIIKRIVIDKKISIILTTHQMEVVKELNSRILLLRNGKIEMFNSFEDIKHNNNYLVTFINDGKVQEVEEEGNFMDIYSKYKAKDIIEIKRIELNLEKIIMEKLNESI